MIKYNGNNAINDWNLGDINITKAYYNGSVCYEKMESGKNGIPSGWSVEDATS